MWAYKKKKEKWSYKTSAACSHYCRRPVPSVRTSCHEHSAAASLTRLSLGLVSFILWDVIPGTKKWRRMQTWHQCKVKRKAFNWFLHWVEFTAVDLSGAARPERREPTRQQQLTVSSQELLIALEWPLMCAAGALEPLAEVQKEIRSVCQRCVSFPPPPRYWCSTFSLHQGRYSRQFAFENTQPRHEKLRFDEATSRVCAALCWAHLICSHQHSHSAEDGNRPFIMSRSSNFWLQFNSIFSAYFSGFQFQCEHPLSPSVSSALVVYYSIFLSGCRSSEWD